MEKANWTFDNTGIIELLRIKLADQFDTVTIKSDAVDAIDKYITSNWKFRLTSGNTIYKGYLGFRNKHTYDDDGDFEFTELSSYTLQPKNNYKHNYKKWHVNDIDGVAKLRNSSNADEVVSAIEKVVDQIVGELTNNKSLYEYIK